MEKHMKTISKIVIFLFFPLVSLVFIGYDRHKVRLGLTHFIELFVFIIN